MMKDSNTVEVREAVGIFDSEEQMQAAIDDLLSHGFDRAEISVLAPVTAVEEKLGHRFVSVADIEDEPAAMTKAFVPIESIGDAEGAVIGSLLYVGAFAGIVLVASGGALAAGLAALALGGSGTAVGVALARLIKQHHADYIADQLEKGGLLLWVRTWDQKDEEKAVKVLSAHSAHDVHIHALPAQD
ncbi:MAG: hypothetical protein GW808_11885 [Sphingomonadales bacterium]|nr:hypothetical protein [Sphingomonadales bacterium]PIX66789.1 MAG: hypothetical protein COZ43_04890 [Sphingomonadales bacterium CG_4_10_14_3_um_filter_58_15]NCO47627.1 hypothetical protein [Sphingomonadales bacterium]NCO98783.1 hypothetical protein [Sphingomonadales bacterium]NCP25724.1 hypothetical protein [Sphingomonadales bacterium]